MPASVRQAPSPWLTVVTGTPWQRLLMRPAFLLVMAYAIAICFERVIDIEVFKPYRLVGATMILLAIARGRIRVDAIARISYAYVALGMLLATLHVLYSGGSMSAMLGDALLWLFNISTYVAICTLLRERREVVLALLVHSLAMLVASYDIYSHSNELLMLGGESIRVSGDFKNPANACLSMLVATMVLISLARAALARSRGLVPKVLLLAAGLSIGLFELYVSSLTGSRAGAFVFVLGIIVYLAVIGRRQFAVMVAGLALGAAALVTQMDAWPKLPEDNILLVRAEHKGLETDRLYLWRSGLDAYVDSYGLGLGIAQYRSVHQEYFEKYALYSDERWADFSLSLHNDYVSALVEFGALGLLLFIALYRTIWRTARRMAETNARAIAMALLLAAAVMGISHAVLPYFGLWFYLALITLWVKFEPVRTAPKGVAA